MKHLSILTRIATLILVQGTSLAQESPQIATEREKLVAIRGIVREHRFVPAYVSDRAHCARLLDDLVKDRHVKAIEPDVRADRGTDPRLAKWHRCENVSVEDMNANDPNSYYTSLAGLGNPPYRYYQIEVDGNRKNGKEDVIHAQATEYGYGGSGYYRVDLQKCIVRSGVGIEARSIHTNDENRDRYRLNMLVKYRSSPMVLEIFSIGVMYEFAVTRLSTRHPRVCSWRAGIR